MFPPSEKSGGPPGKGMKPYFFKKQKMQEDICERGSSLVSSCIPACKWPPRIEVYLKLFPLYANRCSLSTDLHEKFTES